MHDKQKNIFENVSLTMWDIAKAAGGLAVEVFRMPHQLASHGDHFAHPLDEALDTPAYISEEAHMKDYWHGIIDIPESSVRE